MFNSKATLQSRTQTLDAFGGMVESFSTARNFPCRIQPTSADEQDLYSREGQVVTAKAYVSASLAPGTNDRVVFNSRTFYIRGILNPDEANMYKVVYLEEQA